MTVKSLEKDILHLPPKDRIHLIESLIASLNKPDPSIERAWGIESDKRLKAYKKGSVKGLDWETVKKRFAK